MTATHSRVFFALLLYVWAATIGQAQQPNIVYILADDLGKFSFRNHIQIGSIQMILQVTMTFPGTTLP
jgi:hypothetical protein